MNLLRSDGKMLSALTPPCRLGGFPGIRWPGRRHRRPVELATVATHVRLRGSDIGAEDLEVLRRDVEAHPQRRQCREITPPQQAFDGMAD
jgi:hypothetical protein